MLFLYTSSAEAPCTVEEEKTVPSEELHQLATLIGRLSFFLPGLTSATISNVGWAGQHANSFAVLRPSRLLAFSWIYRRR